jgi:hypothetical protein
MRNGKNLDGELQAKRQRLDGNKDIAVDVTILLDSICLGYILMLESCVQGN